MFIWLKALFWGLIANCARFVRLSNVAVEAKALAINKKEPLNGSFLCFKYCCFFKGVETRYWGSTAAKSRFLLVGIPHQTAVEYLQQCRPYPNYLCTGRMVDGSNRLQ